MTSNPVINRYSGHCAGRVNRFGAWVVEMPVRFFSIAVLRFCRSTSCASKWASFRLSAVFSSDSSSGVRLSACGRFISGRLVSRRNASAALFAPCRPDSTRRGSCMVWAVCLRGGEACVLESAKRGGEARFSFGLLGLREVGGRGSARATFACVVAAGTSWRRTGASRSGGSSNTT